MASLDRELDRFKNDLELFLCDKDHFIQELYWRLKQVLSRWRSFNRRGLSEKNKHTDCRAPAGKKTSTGALFLELGWKTAKIYEHDKNKPQIGVE